MATTQSPSPEPDAKPYVHEMPDFMQNKAPKLISIPPTISIKDAMKNRVDIAGIRGIGNKDERDKEKPSKGLKV